MLGASHKPVTPTTAYLGELSGVLGLLDDLRRDPSLASEVMQGQGHQYVPCDPREGFKLTYAGNVT